VCRQVIESRLLCCQGVDRLFETLKRRADENFDKFEMVLFERQNKNGIMLIPDNLTLPSEVSCCVPKAIAASYSHAKIVELHSNKMPVSQKQMM